MRVRWTTPALRDIEKIGDDIALDNPVASLRVVTRIFDQCDQLGTYPHMGRAGRVPGTRELVVPIRPSSFPTACARTKYKCWPSCTARAGGLNAFREGEAAAWRAQGKDECREISLGISGDRSRPKGEWLSRSAPLWRVEQADNGLRL